MSQIIGPMTATATIEQLREELAFNRVALNRQRHAARSARQLLTRINDRHLRGDVEGVDWLIRNWREQLQKWADESRVRSRL